MNNVSYINEIVNPRFFLQISLTSASKLFTYQLNTPTKNSSSLVLSLRKLVKGLALEKSVGINDRKTTVGLTSDRVVDKTLLVPFDSLRSDLG